MISVATEKGDLLKVVPEFTGEQVFGLHSLFGFVSERAADARASTRKRHGLRTTNEGSSWRFNFRLVRDAKTLRVAAVSGCEALPAGENRWKIVTSTGTYFLSSDALPVTRTIPAEEKDHTWKKISTAAILMMLLLLFMPTPKKGEVAPEVMEPITVKIHAPEKQTVVKVPEASIDALPRELQKANVQAKRAIQQNLGFMGLLGKKDLTKALGGMPIALKETSAGAGPGGTQGSGGEVLVGLGQGVKRTTVGNTGMAGLGGIGTKGAGGGAGGYGNKMVGSGEGKGLTSLALSQDVMLEGGLDRSVIQATIAKYLSQVRACYEEGLRKNSGLAGQVSMNFEINGTGDLNFARVGRSTLGDLPVEGCISAKMLNWKFPKPTGGVNVKVAYPFLLRPSG